MKITSLLCLLTLSSTFLSFSVKADDTPVVKKGQWGGLGGRFGEKIRGPIDLPKEVLDTTEKILE